MKNFSSGLLSFLQNNRAFNRADLFAIWLGSLQNLFAQSQDFELSPWGTDSASTTVIPDNATAPDGSMTADTITANLANGNRLQDTLIPISTGLDPLTYTISVWLKVTSSTQAVTLFLGRQGGFDFQSTNVTASTSWQRFSFTLQPTWTGNGTMTPGFRIVTNGASVQFWGAQLEIRKQAGPYSFTGTQPLYGSSGPCVPAIFANSSQVDITYNGVLYPAQANGSWERGTITSEASFDLRGNDMDLTVASFSKTLFPNTSVSYMAAAQLGMFDAAFVQIYTAYWPIGMNQPAGINSFLASVGAETKWAGYIKPSGQIARAKLMFQCADVLYLLNQNMPKRLLQASCIHTLFDPNCTLNPFNFKSPLMTVASGSTAQSLNTTGSLGQSSPYFTQGYICFYSGQNQGWTFAVKSQTSTTNLLLASAVPFPLAIGDTFIAFAGCDKTEGTCQNKFNNLINIGATPFCPNPEVAI